MRYLALTLALALLASSAAATPASDWSQPCFTMRAAYDAGGSGAAPYFRIIQNMSAGAGWSLSSTVPVSMTRTYVDSTHAITTAISTLDRALYTITDSDLDARFDGEQPFVLYHCAPGVNPYRYLPLVVH